MGVIPQTLPLLYQLNLCNILNPVLSFQPSSQHLHRSRFHLRKPLPLLIHRKQRLIHASVTRCSNSVTSLGPTCNSSSCAVSSVLRCATSSVTASNGDLNSAKSSMWAGINFFQTPVHVDTVTSYHESQMVNPFQKIFNWLPRSIKGITIYSSYSLWNLFLT